MKGVDSRLIQITQRSQAHARRRCDVLRMDSDGAAPQVVRQFETFLPRIDQAICQAVQRVIAGEVVLAKEKDPGLVRASHPAHRLAQDWQGGGVWAQALARGGREENHQWLSDLGGCRVRRSLLCGQPRGPSAALR